jgi:hypothetical protein
MWIKSFCCWKESSGKLWWYGNETFSSIMVTLWSHIYKLLNKDRISWSWFILLWNLKIQHCYDKSPLLNLALSPLNPIRTITTYFLQIHFNILSSVFQATKCLLFTRFSNQNVHAFVSHVWYYTHIKLFTLIILIVLNEEWEPFLPFPCYTTKDDAALRMLQWFWTLPEQDICCLSKMPAALLC